MDNFAIEISAANLKFIPIIMTIVQFAKQSPILLKYSEWFTMATLTMGVLFVYMSQGWIMSTDVFFDGMSVGIMACGSYDVIKRVAPKVLNQEKSDEEPLLPKE